MASETTGTILATVALSCVIQLQCAYTFLISLALQRPGAGKAGVWRQPTLKTLGLLIESKGTGAGHCRHNTHYV